MTQEAVNIIFYVLMGALALSIILLILAKKFNW